MANRTVHESTDSIAPHILLWVAQLVALASPSFQGRREIFSAIIIFLALWSLKNADFTTTKDVAQFFALAWANYLSTLEKLLFSEPGGPEDSYWHIDKPSKEAASFPAFGFRKLKWAIVLITNLRGIRWNYQVKNVPTAKTRSRTMFLFSQAIVLVYYFMMADVVNHLWVRLYYTPPDGRIGEVNSKYLTITHPDWRWRLAKTLAWGPLPYYMINIQYAIFSIFAVLLGLSQPDVSQ